MVEDIRFYDFEFNLLAIQADFISANWQIYFNDIGQFEAHFSNDSPVVKVLSQTEFAVAVQGDKAAIVIGYKSKDDFAVFGRTCNWILSRKVVPAFERKSGRTEVVVRELVAAAFSDCEAFILSADKQSLETTELAQDNYRQLSDVIKDCLDLCELGHQVIFDVKNKKWIFEVLCPKEILNVISEGNRNGAQMEFSSDYIDCYSAGWYLEEQEEAEDGTRPEPVWTLKNDTSKTGLYKWECVLSAQTDSEAEKELKKKKLKTASNIVAVDFKWHTDYELGDVVKLKIEKGALNRTESMRIVGVHLWYEENETGEQPIMEV